MDETSRDRVERQLATLLDMPRFRRARLQAAALRLMVAAHLEGKSLSTRELALGVYGKDDEDFLRATRQLTREIRVKLELIHVEPSPDSVEFRLHETRPELVVRIPRSGADKSSPPTGQVARPARRTWLAIGALAIVLTLAALAAQRAGWFAPSHSGVPFRVHATEHDLQIRNREGNRLPAWEEELTAPIFEQLDPNSRYDVAEWLGGTILERDHRPAVRVALVSALPPRPYDTRLQLFDHRRRLLGEFRLPWLPDAASDGPALTELGGEPIPGEFKVFSVSPIEFDGDPSREELLVSVADSGAFPCQVLVLGFDGAWTVQFAYWNMGHAFAQPVGDLDGDGREEIAVYGQNNNYFRAFLTLLSASAESRPRVGRSPEGVRQAAVVEFDSLPPMGFTLLLPRSALAVPEFPDLYRLRALSIDLSHAGDRRELQVIVADGAGRDGRRALRLGFKFDFDRGVVRAIIKDEFDYLELLKRKIGGGNLEDRWGILETDRLDRFSRDLESQIVYWDDRDPAAGWRPLDMAVLRQRFGPSN